ncbi:MATE family efflux transporter [Flavobacterium rhizosphaerae]|uniref:polysaccharide biosynthesis protein n=1 Tax=Flavobacterium rhizosphaerae TaxID=3163298 RepID=UPI0038B54CD4
MTSKSITSNYWAWGKLVGITGFAQIVVQGISFLSGLLLIRILEVDEYAFYTIANTLLGTMTLLADGGISKGVLSEGGKVWKDRNKLGIILATGLDLRKKFAVVSLVVCIPVLVYLLIDHGAGILTVVLVSLCLIPAFFSALSDSLLEMVLKLHQDILPLQKNQVAVALGRLILLLTFIFFVPYSFIAILVAGITRIAGNIRLRKMVFPFADFHVYPSAEVRANILEMVKKLMPGAIYFSISGQITIWLLSFFGNTTSVAQIGALSRLSVVLSLIMVLINTLIIPRYARLRENKNILIKRSFQMTVIISLIIIAFLLIVFLFSNEILWLFGNDYKGLSFELLLCMGGVSLDLISGLFFSLSSARGWVFNPVISISISILTIVIGAILFDISNLMGVLFFNVFLAGARIFIQGGYLGYKLMTLN